MWVSQRAFGAAQRVFWAGPRARVDAPSPPTTSTTRDYPATAPPATTTFTLRY